MGLEMDLRMEETKERTPEKENSILRSLGSWVKYDASLSVKGKILWDI